MDSNKTKLDPDCVCPVCFKQTPPAVMEQDMLSADGIRRRSYSTWCPQCSRGGQGYIVIQFYQGGRWRIEKYIQINPIYIFSGEWTTLQQAEPVNQQSTQLPPVIQTGPGGDFTVKTTDEKMAEALESYDRLLVQLSSCGHLIQNILLNRTHE